MTNAPTTTPWGPPTSVHEIDEGIVRVETTGHGGIWLSDERLAEMPAELYAVPTWCGDPHWFEEDCDWSLVALTFPHLFDQEQVSNAIRAAILWYAPTLNVHAYLRTQRGKKCVLRAGINPQAVAQLQEQMT